MSLQTTFNKAARGMLRQGKKSKRGFVCLYRHPEGLRCPVGFLIPNKSYKKEFEGLSCFDRPVLGVLQKHGHDLSLCKSLQTIHDKYEPEEWKRLLKFLAESLNLKFPKDLE